VVDVLWLVDVLCEVSCAVVGAVVCTVEELAVSVTGCC
jgi:hypothetical protein